MSSSGMPYINQSNDQPNNHLPNSEMKWIEIWKRVLFHPSLETFTEIAEQYVYKKNMYVLLAISIALMSGAVALLSIVWFRLILPLYTQFIPSFSELLPNLPANYLPWIFPAYFLFMTISLFFHIGVAILLARLMGGKGSFSKTIFVYCSFYIPLLAINAVLMFIPVLNIIAGLTGFYMFYLWTVGFKAVQDISWFKAILIIVILPVTISMIVYGVVNYFWMQYYIQFMMNTFMQSYPSPTY